MGDDKKVVPLRGAALPQPGEGDPEVIKLCEEVLEMARSGEIVAIGVAYEYRDKAVGRRSAGPFTMTVLGAIARLAHDLNIVLDRGRV